MSELSKHAQAIIADIKLANNGYLVMAYLSTHDCNMVRELQSKGIVVVTGGLAHLPKTKPEFFKSEYPKANQTLLVDGADYEAMILAHQEPLIADY